MVFFIFQISTKKLGSIVRVFVMMLSGVFVFLGKESGMLCESVQLGLFEVRRILRSAKIVSVKNRVI